MTLRNLEAMQSLISIELQSSQMINFVCIIFDHILIFTSKDNKTVMSQDVGFKIQPDNECKNKENKFIDLQLHGWSRDPMLGPVFSGR